MKLYKTKTGIVVEHTSNYYPLQEKNWSELLNRKNLYTFLLETIKSLNNRSILLEEGNNLMPPIDLQEVWAAGVTYKRSMEARMKEAEAAGGGDFYDLVYSADRPEIFFKANPHRVVGHLDHVKIRKDSTWNVPEPELTLVINNQNQIIGYTIGNDMSSRSIEGENPLYLPQAKTYDSSASLGPGILLTQDPIPLDTKIQMEIKRNGERCYQDQVEIKQMKRSFEELVHFLTYACSFPHGVFLMTGTCLVPEESFTLKPGDEITITIDHIGTLINFVKQ